MNKPVFENVIGEKIDISNVLEDTLSGGAAEAAVKDRQAQRQVAADGSRAPVLDVTQDPNEGRRSIQAFQADETDMGGKTLEGPVLSALRTSNVETTNVEEPSDEVQFADISSTAEKTSTSDTTAVSDFGRMDSAPLGDEDTVSSSSASFAMADEPEEDPKTGINFAGNQENLASGISPEAVSASSVGTTADPPPMFEQPGTDGNDGFDLSSYGPNDFRFSVDLKAGHDWVKGSQADDALYGGQGNDTLTGNAGADVFSGGEGYDTVDYSLERGAPLAPKGGIFVNLGTRGQATNGWNGTPVGLTLTQSQAIGQYGEVEAIFFDSIEAVIGTRFADAFYATGSTYSYYFDGRLGDDGLVGGNGNDTLVGGDGADTLKGSAGNDLIYGNTSDPFRYGDGAVDDIRGDDGDDTIYAGDRDDLVIGGAGNDRIFALKLYYDDSAHENNYAWNIDVMSGQVTRADGQEVDTYLAGNGYSYHVKGSKNWDTIRGGSGNDTLDGGAGYDDFIGSEGSDIIDGGVNGATDGAAVKYDLLTSGGITLDLSRQRVTKTSGSDTLVNIWHAFGTNFRDEISGSGQSNLLFGNGGDDVISGYDGDDGLYGGAGLDRIDGGNNNDRLYGEDDADILDGGAGNDTLDAGAGFDKIIGSIGNDLINGGADGAEIDYSNLSGGITLTLNNTGSSTVLKLNGEQDTIANIWHATGSRSNDVMEGDNNSLGGNVLKGAGGDDQISGLDGTDWLYGGVGSEIGVGTGNDKLYGGRQDDHLFGEDGDDILDGGEGADTMYGGEGNDIFDVDSRDDFTIEYANEGTQDFAFIRVKNYDARKLANIEGWQVVEGTNGSLNYIAEAPVTIAGSANVIDEGLTSDQSGPVALIRATDDGNGGDLNYVLENTFSGLFAITHVGTGSDRYAEIRITRPADFEAMVDSAPDSTGSYIRVDASSGRKYFVLRAHAEESDVANGGLVSTNVGTIEIEIRNTDDTAPLAPRFSGLVTAIDVAENAAFTARFVSGDVDTPTSSLSYHFDYDTYGAAADGNGRFVINAQGQLVLANPNAPLDYESLPAEKFHKIYVRAYDGVRYGATQELIINVTDANDRPNAPLFNGTDTSFTTAENQAFAVQLTATDEDRPANSISFRFDPTKGASASANGLFAIDAAGQLVLANPSAPLDFETMPAGGYKVYVQAYDGTGAPNSYSETRELTIFATDSRDAPLAPKWVNSNVSPTEIWIPENSTTISLTVRAEDPDGEQQDVSYAFVNQPGNYNNFFDINAATGEITLKPGARLDRESTQALKIFVQATDTDGSSPVQELMIRLTDVNEAPGFFEFEGSANYENSSGYAGYVLAEDPEQFPVTYDWADDVPDRIKDLFSLDPDTGAITIISGLDYEAQDGEIHRENGETFYLLKIIARDESENGLESTPVVVRVDVLDQNEALTDATFDVVDAISGNAPADTIVVRSVTVEDPDLPGPNEDFRFSLVQSETDSTPYSGPFSIHPTSGQIKVSGTLSDVDVPTSMTLYVKIADHGGNGGYSIVRPVTFTINPGANNVPTIEAPDATFTITDNDNTEVVAPFAGVTITDLDTTDTITVTITALGEYGGTFVDVLGNAHTGGTYTFSSSNQQELLGRIHGLKFNPMDRPDAVNGSIDRTMFRIEVDDGQGGDAYLVPNISVDLVHVASNAAPDVSVRADGQIEWTTPDNVAVQAFHDLVFQDADTDPVTGQVTVEIWYDAGNGTLDNIIDGEHDEINGYYSFTGTLQQVNEAVTALQFRPHNRPSGPDVTTEFLVKITDGGLAHDQITVTVHATSNDAPVITLAPDGVVNWTVGDYTLLDPFQDLSFSDAEDGGDDGDPNTYIEVKIYFEGSNGDFVGLPDGVAYTPGSGQFIVSGTADEVTAIVQNLHFRTRERPDDPDGTVEETTFQVLVFDTDGAWAASEVTVESVTGNVSPSNIRLDGSRSDTVAETLGVDQAVGTLTAVDENPGTLTYAFADGFDGAGHFRIDGNQIKVASELDYDNPTASGLEVDANGNRFYRLKVIATDNGTPALSTEQQIFVYVTNENEAPTLSVMDPSIIDETLGAGEEVGELHANDPEGDSITFLFQGGLEGGLVSADGAFRIVREVVGTEILTKIVVENPIQVTNPDGEDRGYWIVVTDQEGATSTGRITIHINDVPPANVAPALWIAPGTETTDATDNGMAVYPFRGVDLSDAENDFLTLTISFAAAAGDLGGTTVTGELSEDRQTITYRFENLRADALDTLLHGLTFNPRNDSAAGGPVDTPFTITVTDNRAGHAPVSGQVVVHTTSGNDSGNTAPTITIADDSTEAADNGPAVKPFLTVDLSDADGDILTLTISFTNSHGTLGSTGGNLGTVSGGVRTFVFTGTADTLDTLLRGLTFDPAPDLAAAGQVTTTFTIAVQDSTHAAVTDTVNVVTHHGTTGPGNDPLDITLTPNFVDESLEDRVVGTLAAIDPDVGDTFTYEILDNAGGRFVKAADGVSLKTVGELDWESNDPLLKTDFYGKYYEVTVRATDSYTRSLTKTLKVYVTDVPDNPSLAAPSIGGADSEISFQVEDNKVVSPFGSVTFTDPDSANITVTIALDTATEGRFVNLGIGSYNEQTGVYTVSGLISDVQNAVQSLKFHAADRPNDPVGMQVVTNFSITVSDGNSSVRNENISVVSTAVDGNGGSNQAPTDLDWSGNWAREWSQNGFTIGSLLPVDPDGPSSGSYSFKFVIGTDGDGNPILSDQDAAGRFYIDGDRLKVFDGTKLDFEMARSHRVTIQVSDGSHSFQKEMTVTVRDWFNEAGVGTAASETFKGGAGDDVFDGQDGNDVLYGGYGFDDLTGGDGQDAFVFDTDLISGVFDFIQDFTLGEDTIRLKADVFQLWDYEGGELTDDVFATGTAATTELQRIIYDADTGSLYFDEDGSGEAEAILFAMLTNLPALDKSNFLVI